MSSADRFDSLLRRVHYGSLLCLLLCGIAIALQQEAGSLAPPPLAFTGLVLGLAVASIVLRRVSTSTRLQTAVRALCAAGALILAASIGAVAIALVSATGAKQNALLFVLGAGILCLRPPAVLRPPLPESS